MLAQKFIGVGLLLQAICAMAFSAAIDNCRYRFTEQPSSVLSCNPYPIGKFVTRCIVELTTTEGSPLIVAWYTRTNIGGTSQPMYGGYSSRNTISSIESELTVRLNENMVDTFRTYFCQVSFANGTVLSDSREAYLFSKKSLSNDFKICDDQSVQSIKETKCIDPKNSDPKPTDPPSPTTTSAEPTTPPKTTKLPITTKDDPQTTTMPDLPTTTNLEPMTTTLDPMTTTNPEPQTTTDSDSMTTTRDPSTSTVSDLPVTTSSGPPTPVNPTLQTTTSDPSTSTASDPLTTTTLDVPQTTAASIDLSITTNPDAPPQSTSILDLLMTFAPSVRPPLPLEPLSSSASPQAQPTGSSPAVEVGSGGSFDDEALLFLTIGAAVFIFIIVYFIVFCLCLWSRQCRECGYNFCCTCTDDLCCSACNCCLDDVQ